MNIAVILPAAGIGKRFAQSNDAKSKNKLELDLAGKPVFLRAIELFQGRPDVAQIIIAVNPDAIDDFKFRWGDKLAFHGVIVVPGGKVERWETVRNALAAVNDDVTHVAVHDAARPLATKAMIDRVFEAAKTYDAVIPAVAVSATLKRVADLPADASKSVDPLDAILGNAGKTQVTARCVVDTVDRANVVEVQTPQVFEVSLLRKAYDAITDGRGVTDDAGLVEKLGQTVYVVEGESTNLKITYPADVEIAQAIVEKRESKVTADLARKRLFADDDE